MREGRSERSKAIAGVRGEGQAAAPPAPAHGRPHARERDAFPLPPQKCWADWYWAEFTYGPGGGVDRASIHRLIIVVCVQAAPSRTRHYHRRLPRLLSDPCFPFPSPFLVPPRRCLRRLKGRRKTAQAAERFTRITAGTESFFRCDWHLS